MVSDTRTIDTQLLRVFATVAKFNGVTAAAERLGIAKSAVSKQLAALESALQVKLFERASRRVALTNEGRLLLPRAESILAELEQLATDAQQEIVQVRGTVRIAASPEFGGLLAQSFFPPLLARHPALKIVMSLDYRRDDLHDPNIDLAFRAGTLGDERLVARPLGSFVRILACSPDFADRHALDVPEDLTRCNVLTFSERELSDRWVFHATKPRRRREVEVGGNLTVHGFGALASAAVAGIGVARLPLFLAKPLLGQGQLVHVMSDWSPTSLPVVLAYRAGISAIGRVRAVINAALEVVPVLLEPYEDR